MSLMQLAEDNVTDTHGASGLKAVLQNAVAAAGGVLMSSIPCVQDDLDAEIAGHIQESGSLRFRDNAGLQISSPIRFDVATGRLEMSDSLSDAEGVKHIRSATGAKFAAEFDTGSEYNRRILKIAEQLLALGIVNEVVLGSPLSPTALLYLKPFPTPEDSTDEFVADALRAIASYKPRAINDARKFDTKFAPVVRRLIESGISTRLLTPSCLQETIQTEFARSAVRSEIWRKLWRWTADCTARAAELRRLPAIVSDSDLQSAVTSLETAIKRISSIIATYVGNATAHYKRAVEGTDFYVEAPLSILYVRETAPKVDQFFHEVSRWAKIWETMPESCTIGDAKLRLEAHLPAFKRALTMVLPPNIVF